MWNFPVTHYVTKKNMVSSWWRSFILGMGLSRITQDLPGLVSWLLQFAIEQNAIEIVDEYP